MAKLIFLFVVVYLIVSGAILSFLGSLGLWGGIVANQPTVFILIYTALMTHFTISAMSLSFHRYHSHKSIVIDYRLDFLLQMWLWMVTSMSKLDWVAIHIYHHSTSDTDQDPHSPVHKGFFHVFFLGVWDYSKAKNLEPVKKIKKTIAISKYEKFIHNNSFLGPIILTLFLLIGFGPYWGALLGIINFLISPIFAVGGVNALAHFFGYRNHDSSDNSRNLGFLFPLNFLICGELDHNNHHAHPKSCSFRNRWFEFDIGYLYLIFLNKLGLVKIKYVYDCYSLKKDLLKKINKLIEFDKKTKESCELLAWQLNMTYQEINEKIELYILGKQVKMEKSLQDFVDELKQKIILHPV